MVATEWRFIAEKMSKISIDDKDVGESVLFETPHRHF